LRSSHTIQMGSLASGLYRRLYICSLAGLLLKIPYLTWLKNAILTARDSSGIGGYHGGADIRCF
jgi:hypothetical protein